MKKQNAFCILALLLSIINIILMYILNDNGFFSIIVCASVAILSLIFGVLGKKQIKSSHEKGEILAILSFVINIVNILVLILSASFYIIIKDVNFNDANICPDVTECVKDDNISTCKYLNQFDVKCSTDKLDDKQFKK